MRANKKEREEFKKESDRLLNASEDEINSWLIKLGYDPEKVRQDGIDLIRRLKEKYKITEQ